MIPRKLMYESDKGKLFDHFLVDIVGEDRYLRFAHRATNENIQNYLEESLLRYGSTDIWFVAEHDDKFVGTVHVSVVGDTAEMGFTVSPDFRGQGIGQDLFVRGATWAMMKGAKTIYTVCLSENKVMQHIAKKNGMTVVTIDAGEKEATIQATKGKIRAFYEDNMFDHLAFVDRAITKQNDIYKTLMRL
jgi:RimJ/RimL family protein N-acetyltransferase